MARYTPAAERDRDQLYAAIRQSGFGFVAEDAHIEDSIGLDCNGSIVIALSIRAIARPWRLRVQNPVR
ncbi:MAG: hypothetical protein ACREM6_03955 [Vulcanimicrobiaceae bacterium]